MILFYLTEKSFGRSIKFHSNLLFKSNKTKFFPSSCREIILYWKKHLAMMTGISSCILSQHLWYNANIQVDKLSIHFSRFSKKNNNYVSQLFNNSGSIKKWHKFNREYDLHQNSYFQWVQLIDCSRKMEIYHKTNNEVVANLITHDHHLFFFFFFFLWK